ncbi:MAG: hypothetical protein ACRC0X_07925 [Brevinema sp.]
MKKSLLALSVLFILGACSVAPSSEVKGFLGGKTVEVPLLGEGTFNADATELTIAGEKFKIQKGSSSTSATYKATINGSEVTIYLTEITKNGGNVESKGMGEEFDGQKVPFLIVK